MMMNDTVILRVAVKLLVPVILMFALYVQFHGDYGPGGGFQAGVAAATAIILYALVFGLRAAQRVVPPDVVLAMIPIGVIIFAGTGVVSLLLNDNFLNYSHFAHEQSHGQHYGILIVELGVLITVAATMLAIFYAFAGRNRNENVKAVEPGND